MADLATIGIRFDSSGIRQAEKGLDDLAKQGGRTESSLNNSSASISRGFSSVQSAVALVGTAITALTAGALSKYADTATSVENQLRAVTNSTTELADAQARLGAIANQTRSGYESTVELYSKLSRSTTELNISQERLYRITETINKSFASSGATAIEADNAIRQLAQGLSAGALRGDEFNSVAEQAPEILRAVAAETGKTIGELREFAAEGGITSELLIKSLENYQETVDRVYGKTSATISQSLTVANNNVIKYVENNEKLRALAGVVGESIVALSNNIDRISSAALAASSVIGLNLVASITSAAAATLTKVKADLSSAAAAKAAAVAELELAAATAAQARTSAAASAAEAKETVQRLTSTQAALTAEMNLEKVRLAAQISETGRIQTATRMAEIGAARVAVTAQLTAAETRLTAATTASTAADAGHVTALGAVSAAQARTTVTATALGAAWRFMLGPWGLLLTAVGAGAAAFYATNSEMDKSVPIVKDLSSEIDTLTGSIDKMTKSQRESLRLKIEDQLATISARKALIQFNNELQKSVAGFSASEVKEFGEFVGVTGLNMKTLSAATAHSNAEMDSLDARSSELSATMARLSKASGGASGAIASIGGSAETAIKKMAELDEALGDRFDAEEELAEIENSRIASKERQIEAELEWEETSTKGVEKVATLSEKAAERIESAFADAWMNAFDGMNSVVDGMKNAFKRMLAEMAHMALTRPIMVSLGMGGMLPGAANAGGLGGLSSGLGLLGGIGGGITSLGGMLGGAFGGGLAGAGGLVSAGNIGGLFSGAGPLFGSGNIAAGLGMSMPIIAGAVVAALGINKLTGGGLFGTSYKTTGQDLGLSLGGGDISGMITTEESKKKSLFRGTSRRTSTSAYDATALDSAFDQITDALSQAANTFGITGADAIINGFSSSVKINIKDKSEAEIQQAISDWVGSTTAGLVNAVFGDSLAGLQKEGEGVIDTVNRLSMNMGVVSSITKALGLGFDLTGKAAMVASTNIVELAGGLDQLSALSSQYYQSFYSETEKQLRLQEQLAGEFSKLNSTVPVTRDQFRAMVDALNLTTAADQAKFAALMQLVPTMDQYLSSLEAQTDATQRAAEAATKEAEAKAAALKASQSSLELRLLDALGDSSAALAMRRQMELAATDESLRALLLQIYAAEDAATAQKALEAAQKQAADAALDAAAAMREAANAAQDMAQNAFSKLQDAAKAEIQAADDSLENKLSAIEIERKAAQDSLSAVQAGYNEQINAAQRYADNMRSISDTISGFLSESKGALNPFKRLTEILSEAKAGLMPSSADLNSALSGISSAGSVGFNSAFEQTRANAIAQNQAKALLQIVGNAATDADAQVQAIISQSAQAEAFYAEQLAKLDTAAELAQSVRDNAVAGIEAQLSAAEKQLNAMLGVDDRVLTMTQALNEFYSAVTNAQELALAASAAEAAVVVGGSVNVEAAIVESGKSIVDAIVDIGQTIIDAGRPEDRIWLPPVAPEQTLSAATDDKEMKELLMKILEASKANAEHSSKSASMLQEMTIGGIDVRVEA